MGHMDRMLAIRALAARSSRLRSDTRETARKLRDEVRAAYSAGAGATELAREAGVARTSVYRWVEGTERGEAR